MRERLHRPLANIRTLCSLLLVAILGNAPVSTTASPAVSLTHGTLVGAVKPMQAKMWLRTSASATVQVEYSTSVDSISSLFSSEAMTTQQKDWTATIQLSKLVPETKYFYRVLINGFTSSTMYQLKRFIPIKPLVARASTVRESCAMHSRVPWSGRGRPPFGGGRCRGRYGSA